MKRAGIVLALALVLLLAAPAALPPGSARSAAEAIPMDAGKADPAVQSEPDWQAKYDQLAKKREELAAEAALLQAEITRTQESLKKMQKELAANTAQTQELRFQLEALEELLYEQKANAAMNPVGAEVIGHGKGPYFTTLTLSAGADQGIQEGMAVIAQGGLVGVTCDVTAKTCGVRCLIHDGFSIAGLLVSSRDQGTVYGGLNKDGYPLLRMEGLPEASLPRPGDIVVTSGVGTPFPKGIPIGCAESWEYGNGGRPDALVLEPVVDFQRLEYVTVLRYIPSYAE